MKGKRGVFGLTVAREDVDLITLWPQSEIKVDDDVNS